MVETRNNKKKKKKKKRGLKNSRERAAPGLPAEWPDCHIVMSDSGWQVLDVSGSCVRAWQCEILDRLWILIRVCEHGIQCEAAKETHNKLAPHAGFFDEGE